MSKIVWGALGSKRFEAGVDRGVLYVGDEPGVPWDGLVGVTVKSTGGAATPYYLDGVKYLNRSSPEEKEGTIEAFTSPPEFDVCDGVAEVGQGLLITQQQRLPFGFCYRTGLGNDLEGLEYGYKLHLIYNALAAPASRKASTLTNTTELPVLAWDFTTTPVYSGPSLRPTAHVILDSTRVNADVMRTIEAVLYGTSSKAPRLISLVELIRMFPSLRIIDNGDGTWTATGSDAEIQMLSEDKFQITARNVDVVDDNTYRIRSDDE